MSRRVCLPLLLLPLLAACSYDPVVAPSARGVPVEAQQGMSEEEAAIMLATHNRIRSEAGVSSLQWSSRIARSAQDWADHLGQRCRLAHNPETAYGENLFMGSAYHLKPADAAISWEKEKPVYQGGVLTKETWMASGHYTQVIWDRTRAMGCGVAVCGGGGQMIVVCNYDPAGNVLGQSPK